MILEIEIYEEEGMVRLKVRKIKRIELMVVEKGMIEIMI